MRTTSWGAIVGLLLVIVALMVSVSAQAPQSANPIAGTWKFNPQKSKMSNTLPPKSMVRKYEDRGNGVIIFTQDLVDAGGARRLSMYVAREDGQDYPLVVQYSDTLPTGMIAFKRVDATTVEQIEKGPNGNVTSSATRKVSPDGRTLTLTVRAAQGGGGGDDAAGGIAAAAAAKGQTIERDVDVMVFDKQ
jgi:hypothetical protein